MEKKMETTIVCWCYTYRVMRRGGFSGLGFRVSNLCLSVCQ